MNSYKKLRTTELYQVKSKNPQPLLLPISKYGKWLSLYFSRLFSVYTVIYRIVYLYMQYMFMYIYGIHI